LVKAEGVDMTTHQHWRTPRVLTMVIATVVAAGAVERAAAEDYCVTCQGPAAMYACGIEGMADAAPNPRFQLLCITELAKAGGHESCQVPRSAPKPCPGIVKLVQLPAAGSQAAEAEPAPAVPPGNEPTKTGTDVNSSDHQKSDVLQPGVEPGAVDGAPTRTADDKALEVAPPRTVEEMAKRSVEQTKKELDDASEALKQSSEKAGGTVATAAKKTWDCVTSLFSDCK
jgi:hypothetical protein